jgi:hypothetical protein
LLVQTLLLLAVHGLIHIDVESHLLEAAVR